MDIRLLGPVQVWRDRTQVDVGPRQQRFVLAVLAVEVNRVVTVDRLVDLCCPGGPPATARHAIRVNVSRLRAALDTAELTRERGGYVLRADPVRVDAHRFRALADQARRSAHDVDRGSTRSRRRVGAVLDQDPGHDRQLAGRPQWHRLEQVADACQHPVRLAGAGAPDRLSEPHNPS
ncbi:MAG TPA: hypothetical protein VGX25_25090 [Actinophytocola sp.]|uniref:AfsR/SARP family transcriptional regulator n=1 Tax=Actinophytocola sp. TaxID=1872138 RepID=UPI002DDD07CB|nr:hypothetical protein [Actinophytocola sp.]HEV2782680.1 hypothetical protein [Actinophytocola sp.]